MKLFRWTLLMSGLGLVACSDRTGTAATTPPEDPHEFVRAMGAGWNLGNSFDAIGPDETAWGNPSPTRELIDAVADAGFRSIRIPVTWHEHMGPAPDYTVDPAWFEKVERVVGWALDRDLIVILNTHHENEWTIPLHAHEAEVSQALRQLWTQIARRFERYDHRLIFEPLNETRVEGTPTEWSGGTEEERECINRFQKASLEAIRATGGNNAKRWILIAQHAASTFPEVMEDLVIPHDDPRTLVSVHVYFPVPFALFDSPNWGTDEDRRAVEEKLDSIRDHFAARGKAVVIGEWGSTHNGNLAERVEHTRFFAHEAVERGMAPVWWDNGGADAFGIFDRRTGAVVYPEIVSAILEGVQAP